MSDCITNPSASGYLNLLAVGAEEWTNQGVPLALTGGYNPADNITFEKEWQKHPIRSVGEFWQRVDAVTFEVRGIAAIHGLEFGTFALDMDKEVGRTDFEWLITNGYVTDDDMTFRSPGGYHVVWQHDLRLIEGRVRQSKEHPGCIMLDDFDGPRGDGTLHTTLRGRVRPNVTKIMPTRRPVSGENYTATHGWAWRPMPLPAWFRLPANEYDTASPDGDTFDGSLTDYEPDALAALDDPSGLQFVNDEYIRKAVVGESRRILESTAHVDRNNAVYAAARRLGEFVRVGRVTYEFVEWALVKAALVKGLDRTEAIATVQSGVRNAIGEVSHESL